MQTNQLRAVHNLSEWNVRASSAVTITVLSNLKICCTQCNRQTTVSVLDSHMQSNCSGHSDCTSAAEMLSQPVSAPTLPVEKKLAEKLVRRLFRERDSRTIRIPTRGQVYIHVETSIHASVIYFNYNFNIAYLSRGRAEETCFHSSCWCLLQQNCSAQAQHSESGKKCIGLDLEEEIQAMPREKRRELLWGSLPVEIPVDHSLAIKSSLSISWNKLRKLRRYSVTKILMSGMHALYIHYCRCMFNVSMASEQKQRALAKQTTQENLEADVAPFAFPAANKGEQDELREAAYVFVPSVWLPKLPTGYWSTWGTSSETNKQQ